MQNENRNEEAVSPVIATILMVAITVVLSGVVYVWAAQLADTDTKGVPRVTFDATNVDTGDTATDHWKITIGQAQTVLGDDTPVRPQRHVRHGTCHLARARGQLQYDCSQRNAREAK